MKYKVGDIVVIRKDSHLYLRTRGMIFRVEGRIGVHSRTGIIYSLSYNGSFYPISEGHLMLYKDMVRDRLLDFIKEKMSVL